MSRLIISFPTELRPRLPTIVGNVDYLTLRLRLEQIDDLLRASGVEEEFVELALKGWLGNRKTVSARPQQQFQLRSRRALRCNLLRTLLQEDYRGFSCQLAGNPLYQWFCLSDAIDVVRVPSKSELQRFANWLQADPMRSVINGDPEEFLRRINRLSMEMTHQRRQKESSKGRKRVLRQMKKVVKTVRSHARRHRELLDKNWEKTEWTRPEADQVLARIDRVLELLPQAQDQAHERIIGQRLVKNEEKILSLYDTDAQVIVRGKAGADVEFGNTVLLGENRQGIILDFEVFKEQAPADSQLMRESLMRVWENLDRKVGAVAGDRGFFSKANKEALEESGTFDGLCPRAPQELKKRMKGKRFSALQRRRSQTEARIGILKAGFFGRPMRAKGFENRELAVTWGVLTHNLWMLARLRKTKPKKKKQVPLLKAA